MTFRKASSPGISETIRDYYKQAKKISGAYLYTVRINKSGTVALLVRYEYRDKKYSALILQKYNRELLEIAKCARNGENKMCRQWKESTIE